MHGYKLARCTYVEYKVDIDYNIIFVIYSIYIYCRNTLIYYISIIQAWLLGALDASRQMCTSYGPRIATSRCVLRTTHSMSAVITCTTSVVGVFVFSF